MKKIWSTTIVVAAILAAGVAAAESPSAPAPDGAFESLSPGGQKIALAIFRSERPTPAGRPVSLDQIAQMKQSGQGWGEIFHELKAQGLVRDKNLGQAVSRMHHGGGPTAGPRTEFTTASGSGGRTAGPRTEITTASGRTMTVGGRDPVGGPDPVLAGRHATASGEARSEVGATAAGSQRTAASGATAASGSAGRGGGGGHAK